jgi:hypothetical protein
MAACCPDLAPVADVAANLPTQKNGYGYDDDHDFDWI